MTDSDGLTLNWGILISLVENVISYYNFGIDIKSLSRSHLIIKALKDNLAE